MIRHLAIACLLAAPLAACDGAKEGTTVSLNATDPDGNVVAAVDGKTGQVSINAPGFTGKMNLPKIQIDADNFDMNGVHLYPGSKISTMNIDAHDRPGKDDDGSVRVSFDSPAAPTKVRDWFQQKLTDAGFTLQASGNGLTGKTNEGKPFSLDLTPAGADHSNGTISIS
jgi:hypothetical protein